MHKHPLFLGLALVAVGALAFFSTPAVAEDDAPTAAPATKVAPKTVETPVAKAETATTSPIHSILKWVGSQAMPDVECACPSTEAGEAAWRSWFSGDKVALKSLRDSLVADGWNADRTVSFFKQMASQKSCGGDCAECPSKSADASGAADASTEGKCDCSKKAGGCCDKAKADGSGAADASTEGKSDCAKKAGGCCNKGSADASGAADASTEGKSDCAKKAGGCCDKSKADGSGAADASTEGKCCGGCKAGKDASECPESCPCAKQKAAKEAPAPTKNS